MIMLSYALIRVAELPTIAPEITIVGLLIRFEINTRLIMLTLAAALTAAGSDWLLRTHPGCDPESRTYEHWILPGLASLGLGAILTRLPEGPGLWFGLPVAALLLTTVLVAEFIVFDPEDRRYEVVGLVLRTLAYLLLAGSLFAINGLGLRAFFAVPLTFGAAGMVSWRLMRLEGLHPGVALRYAILIGMIAAQLDWTLHYWPLPPLQIALIIGLSVYISYHLVGLIRRGELRQGRWIEISIVGLVGLLAIILID